MKIIIQLTKASKHYKMNQLETSKKYDNKWWKNVPSKNISDELIKFVIKEQTNAWSIQFKKTIVLLMI